MNHETDARAATEAPPADRPVTLEEALGPGSPMVVFDRVSLAFDDAEVLKEVSFTLITGHTKVILGASGAGKSTILKLAVGLLKPDAGIVWVNGERVDALDEAGLMPVRSRVGMVFQEGALFDSLTVAENVGFKLYEESGLPLPAVRERVEEVLGFVGLQDYIDRMPSDLSGGQRRRVAIARAIAARPRLLLYDEPTTGLDPITATTVDDEIIKLRDLEGVSSILVTHQLRDAFYVATHEAVREQGAIRIVPVDHDKAEEAEFMMLRRGAIVFEGTAEQLRGSRDGYLRDFLS
jgi:phospholipid/cholesterol/gamma-HCH transport system ATP-binding protein